MIADAFGAVYYVPYSHTKFETYLFFDLHDLYNYMSLEVHCLTFHVYFDSTFTVFLSDIMFNKKNVLFETSDSIGLQFIKQSIVVPTSAVQEIGSRVKLVFASRSSGNYSSIAAAISNVVLEAGNCLSTSGMQTYFLKIK